MKAPVHLGSTTGIEPPGLVEGAVIDNHLWDISGLLKISLFC